MRVRGLWCCLVLTAVPCAAVLVDRIAVVVNDRVVKHSDVERDIRITDFLNGDKLDFSEPARKKSAQRLVDQVLIRREVQVGGYPKASPAEADKFLRSILQQRFHNSASDYQNALREYGITDQQLRDQLSWQITALHFIEERFRPAVLVSDEEVEAYRREHASEFKDQTAEDARNAARERLTEEGVNEQFERWLQGAHTRATIEYHEAGLQ